ncbi:MULTISPECIES: signal peptidase I [unclassified Paenibacillus]|uniref:signal peptidase I n=1 Tax=unclassified Paenibacillus TaxID=185978 RepID=UPI001AE5BEBB|nr:MULTISPECIES: signal peptidase I [unclassified Paenibacillus]MBP1157536.1 signal peptidase I [Paenibacillus sp. PvP091]MBP1171727.1 signal peptidase I [Paenibacillus sp. PvR098]MBP2438108.1 signal peptidase I [Paenibacillus sp. PvP052]
MRLYSPKDIEPEPEEGLSSHRTETVFLLELWDWMKLLAISLLAVVLLHQYGFHLSTVKGASMQPTLQEGEWLFINKTIRFTGSPKQGDIIVLREPAGSDTRHPYLVKRVVAVGGDEVHIRGGRLYVNGSPLEESYTNTLIEDGRFEPYMIMEGHLFVMGDNRHRYASNDSRSFGAVPISNVEGRGEMIVWPPNQWRSL